MLTIDQKTGDDVIDISLDTLRLKKQSIIFVGTKKGAEASAEKIALKIPRDEETAILAESVEKALSTPTKQCKRLAKTLEKGIAFHHSGLSPKQRRIIEEGFRDGKIKIICSTTTLGAGLDLPAFRSVIRDLKRFSPGWGSVPIPVLEYEQMSGRAGRPSFDSEGQAICIATSAEEKEFYWDEYINGKPEDITSKLAVEPVLRTYVLSLISSQYAKSFQTLMEFLSLTFYAHQYKDLDKIEYLVRQVINSLEEYEFIQTTKQKTHFFSAPKKQDFEIKATRLGIRVSQLYLDPYTAHELITGMMLANKKTNTFPIIQLICTANEMRPLMNPRRKEQEIIENKIIQEHEDLLTDEKSKYSEEYYEFMASIKTAIVLEEWMSEKQEDYILEEYNVTPGELNAKIERANWLLYSAQELARILPEIKKENLELHITRERLIKGIKEELLPLVKLKGIGRVRARKLYNNRIRNVKDIKKTDLATLTELIGQKNALEIKKQVGQNLADEKIITKPNKRKGQINLNDYDK